MRIQHFLFTVVFVLRFFIFDMRIQYFLQKEKVYEDTTSIFIFLVFFEVVSSYTFFQTSSFSISIKIKV